MTEYLTVENFTLVLTLALATERFLRWLAPQTQTLADDAAVAEIDRARAWAGQYAPAIYAVVEQLAATGKIAKAEKAVVFLDELEEAYRRTSGKVLPDQAKAAAITLARGMAASDKIGNPQPAPVSR